MIDLQDRALTSARRLRQMPTADIAEEREYIRFELAYLADHNDYAGAGQMATFWQGCADSLDAELSRRARAGTLPIGGTVPTWGTHEILRVKDSTSIADLAGRLGLDVKTTAPGRAVALCPFHTDTNASLVLYEDSGQYHCFACGAHGDTFDLFQKVVGATFPAAVRQLAAWAGVRLAGGAR